MIKYKKLCLIGTSHIAEQSIKEVRKTVDEEKPNIIAIELDKRRLVGLLNKKHTHIKFQDIFQLGVKAYLFTLIASYVQKRLGRLVGVKPGSEMLEAVRLAKENKLQLALIDQDISITLKNFSKAFTWKEKWNFLVDIFKGLVFRKNQIAELGTDGFDLTKVPSKKVVAKLLKNVKLRYPSIYKVLIKDRNYVMARNLAVLLQKYPEQKIVAVVGAGHEDEILKLVKKIDESKIEFVA